MTEQLKQNRSWDKIARDLLTADGEGRFDDTGKTGNVFFLGAHSGADAPNEMAAETSRVFLGIQINCAQCHDHPTTSGSVRSSTSWWPTSPARGIGWCATRTASASSASP